MAGRDFSAELFGPAAGRDFSAELFGAKPPPEKQSAFRQVADIPLGIAKGAVQGVRMIADAFGAGSDTSKAIKSAETYLADLMSAQAKNDQQEISRIMKDAEDKCVLDQVKAAVKAFSIAPVDTLSSALGTAAPVIVGALGAKVLGAGALVSTGVSALTGAGMGAGTIKGSIYEETKNALKEAGASEQDAEARAKLAQEYNGKNLDQILLGTVLGGAAALGPLEKGGAAILARRILGKTGTEATESVAEQTAKGALRRRAEAGVLEAVPEAVQAGQEKVAENIALQREGFDVPTFRGAAGAATLEAIAGGGLGATIGGGKPEVAPAIAPEATPSIAPATPPVEAATAEVPPVEAPPIEPPIAPPVETPVAEAPPAEPTVTPPVAEIPPVETPPVEPAVEPPAAPPVAEAPTEAPKVVTAQMLEEIGVKPTAAIVKRLEGLPLDAPEVTSELTSYANRYATPETKPQILNFVQTLIQPVTPVTPEAPTAAVAEPPAVAATPVTTETTTPVETVLPEVETPTVAPTVATEAPTIKIPAAATPEAPTAIEPPKVITAKILQDIGVSPSAAIIKRLEGLPVEDPKVASELESYANKFAAPEVKPQILNFVQTLKQPVAPPVAVTPAVPETPPFKEGPDVQLDVAYGKKGPEGSFLSDKTFLASGSESDVYRAGNSVFKIAEPYNDKSEDTYQARIKTARDVDQILGDGTLKVSGFYLSPNGTKNPVFQQEFVEGRPATREEIRKHMESRGFAIEEEGKLTDTFAKVQDGQKIVAKDLDGDNVKVDSGNKVRVIDGSIIKTPIAETPAAPTAPEIEATAPVAQPSTLEEFRERMPLVFDNAEVRAANNEGDFAKLTKALQRSTNPAIRRIGQLGGGIASKITLKKPARLRGRAAGRFTYDDDAIQMIPSYAGDEHTNAHETLHALIARAQRNPTEKQRPVVQQIDKLYEHVKRELKKKGITVQQAYGLKNAREFTAEAMTNPEFQFELMQIPYPGKKTAWTQFVKLVADLLGIQNTNALTEVMNLVDRLAMQKPPRRAVSEKGLAEEMEVPEAKPSVVTKATAAAQKALQKQPMPEKGLSHVSKDLTNLAQPIFFPQNKTVLDRIDSMKDRFWQRLAQKTADQFRTIKEYSPLGYMQARLSKSVDGSLEGLLFHGQVFDDGGALNIKKNTKGMMEILKPIGTELDSYLMWVALNRESRLPEEKRSKIPNMDKLVSRRAEFAAGELNGKPRVEVYQDVLKQMNQLNKSVLDIALAKGLIDQKGYDTFSNDIYYIPFYKKMDEDGTVEGAKTASGLTSQDFSKELKGSEAPFGDLMENIVRNWSHILSASMKNAAAQTTLNDAMELQAAEPNLKAGLEWKDGKVYSTKSGKPIEAKFDEDGTQLYAEGELRPDLTTGAAGMAKVMVNGQPMYFKVTDDLLMDSISSIGYLGPKSKFLDVARGFKNMLQYGVTASPIFKVNNLIRDSVSALAVSDLKKSPVSNVMKGISLSKPDSPTYISALAGGAIFNFGSAYEGDQAKLIKRLIDQGVEGDTILDSKEKITKALKKTWDAYQHLGDRSEAANRLALYQQLRDKGMSHLEASFMARDLLDFSMQGSWPAFRLITQVVPFMNARIQGLYKLGRDGINPTVRVLYNATTGKEIDANDKIRAAQFATVSAAVMLASALLYLTFKDDEDFKKRDAWDRDNFWWFKIPSLDIAFRVPKPFEVGAFGTLVERSLEQILDQGAEGKTFGESLKRTLWDTFALNPTPQMFKPLLDIYANKDSFSGAPIESAGLERLSKQERVTEQTSPLAIAMSAIWSTFMPEKLESSPVQMDYAIKGYFGWLGAMASLTSTYAVMPFKEGEYPDARWLDRASLGLVRDLPAPQSAYVTAFYNASKEISQAYADMRHYREMGDAEKVQELLEEKGDKIALAKFYDKTAKNIANVRKQIQLITNDKNLDGAEKKEMIERMKLIMSDLAKQAEEVRKSMKP